MNKSDYKELLKDGRWQRKRLEVMQRDDFKCTKCGTTNDLNVHHLRYIAGHKPWEYDSSDLITLCGSCHKATHEEMEREEQDFDDYCECVWRAKQNDGLFLYYERIGDLQDVITAMRVDADDYPALYNLDFYWHDVMPYSKDWRFSGCAGANSMIVGTAECAKVRHHVWHNIPDEILTKEQFQNARRGFNWDKSSGLFDSYTERFLNDYYFNYAEQKYNERESKEKERAERVRQLNEIHNRNIIKNQQKNPSIVLPKMSLSWGELIKR